MGKRNPYRRIAHILWGSWELWGFISWIGGGVVSAFISFIFTPFAQDLSIWLKILYGAGLFGAVLLITVIIFHILHSILKPQTETGLSQSVADNSVGRDIILAGRDVNVYPKSKPEISIQEESIIIELENKKAAGYSMLEVFDALRDSFALGLTYPQIHNILKGKLNRYSSWGFFSSNILATFTQLGLIHSPSIDPNHSVWLDSKRTIPNYVYQLTDKGNLLAHKLMSQKPKIDKEGSPTE